jgi:hypothetical protein
MGNAVKPTRSPAALGLRAHSGWASAVAISLVEDRPVVLDRRRLELVVAGPDAVRQPFHAAEGQDLTRARAIVTKAVEGARRLAAGELRELLEALEARGSFASAAALLTASGRQLPDLSGILASHALIHAAEGELFRDALRSAAAECNLALVGVPEKEVWTRAAGALRRPAGRLREEIAALRKTIGPPWREDEKLATAAALVALAGSGSPSPV